jgi:type II secretory ATPase GspE/PulE/Tfp pilus assembly ATPase PilB-like protein
MATFFKGSAGSTNKGRSLEEQLEYQKKLNSITNRIHSASSTDAILLNLQGEILSLFDTERITVYVVDGIRKQIVSRFKTGNEIKEIGVPINNESIAGYCALSGRVVNVPDAYDQDGLKQVNPQLKFDMSWDQKTGFKTTQILSAPITYNKYLLGVMQLINKVGGNRFTQGDQSSVMNIANVLGIAFYKNLGLAKKTKLTKFETLITNNVISSKNLDEAMSRARRAKKSVESVLLTYFHVSKDDLGRSLSEYYQARFLPYDDKMIIPNELFTGIRRSDLKSNGFVPIARSGDKVTVAMENPTSLPARDAIKRLIPAKEFEYCVSVKEDIDKMIDLFFDVKRREMLTHPGSIEDILGQLEPSDDDCGEEAQAVTEEDGAIVRLVNKMIVDAHNQGASDIHIEPRQGKASTLIRFRIDGACQVYQTLPHTHKRAVISRIKIMADLDIAERRRPQDGKIKFKRFTPLDVELRVATIPTAGQNEDVVMRLLPGGKPIPLDKMDMSERNYNAFLGIIQKPYGIVLVVGPTGSGKTTTLHAALAFVNRPETKIWTAEDPVEITQEGLRQVQVLPKIGFDFATAMRSFLRADPDVIMVGEMRDRETASTGIEASLTGHLVFSTLHTNSAPETITRLLDMGMDTFNFADALLGVLAQRLVRTLCKGCKEKYHPTRKEFDGLIRAYDGDFDTLGFEYGDDFFLFRGKGCRKCNNTGYKGRTGIHELIVGTKDLKLLVQNRVKIEELREQAKKDGMTTLMQDGVRKVCLGLTDVSQVRRVCIK